MSDVQELVLARFLTLYGEPKTDNLEAFITEYETALAGTSREVLAAGADRVIRAQEFRSWPTPGECVKACQAAAEHFAIARRRETPAELDRKPWPEPSDESKARVRALVERFKRGIAVSGPVPGGALTETSKRMTGESETSGG